MVTTMMSPDRVREGIVFDYGNYYEFLKEWLEESNKVLMKCNAAGQLRQIEETITPTTRAEKSRIILPAGVFDRNDLLHCDMIITGLPPSVFFGSGFGHRSVLARDAAAKDLVDKCYRVGLITEALHASIGNSPFFKKNNLPRDDYFMAVDALVDLNQKMSECSWPWDIFSARELEQEVLDRLKTIFNSVMSDIYYREQRHCRKRLRNGSMDTNGSMSSGITRCRKKTEFCRRCNITGHSERECRSEYSEKGARERSRSPMPLRKSRKERHYEHIRQNERLHSDIDVRDCEMQYTVAEIAQKIAQQSEALLRREMMMRSTEGSNASHSLLSKSAFLPQSVVPFGSDPASLVQPVTTLVDNVFLEDHLRTFREEGDFHVKIDAEVRMEEEQRLKEKERELERRMQKEFEERKRVMEEEIRKQVQLEERAKLQMELAQNLPHQMLQTAEHTFPSFSLQNPSSSAFVFPPSHSTLPGCNYGGDLCAGSYSSAPDFEMEDIKRLVKETEDKLLDLQRNAREAELKAIFQSRAFQTVAELGDNAYLLDRRQKQILLCELKDLLSHAGPRERDGKANEHHRSISREKSRKKHTNRCRGRNSSRRSRSPKHHNSYRDSGEKKIFKDRHHVGGIALRNLSSSEQHRLEVGDVVTQDLETGKWTTAHIAMLSSDRTTLSVGNVAWNKDLHEFKEVPGWSS